MELFFISCDKKGDHFRSPFKVLFVIQLSQVKTIQVHHLIPGSHKILNKFFF